MKPFKIPRHKINAGEAFKRHERIAEREKVRRALFLDNVVDLVKMFDTQEYKAILGFGPDAKWSGYLALTEVFMARGEIEQWRKIYDTFVVKLGVDIGEFIDIPATRLLKIAQYAHTKDELLELMSHARTDTPQAWRDTCAEKSGRITSDQCSHLQKRTFEQCEKCGSKHQVVGKLFGK